MMAVLLVGGGLWSGLGPCVCACEAGGQTGTVLAHDGQVGGDADRCCGGADEGQRGGDERPGPCDDGGCEDCPKACCATVKPVLKGAEGIGAQWGEAEGAELAEWADGCVGVESADVLCRPPIA